MIDRRVRGSLHSLSSRNFHLGRAPDPTCTIEKFSFLLTATKGNVLYIVCIICAMHPSGTYKKRNWGSTNNVFFRLRCYSRLISVVTFRTSAFCDWKVRICGFNGQFASIRCSSAVRTSELVYWYSVLVGSRNSWHHDVSFRRSNVFGSKQKFKFGTEHKRVGL